VVQVVLWLLTAAAVLVALVRDPGEDRRLAFALGWALSGCLFNAVLSYMRRLDSLRG